MAYEEDDQVYVVRHQNRILRKVNRALRRTRNEIQEQADANFLQVCEVKSESQLAVEKLWTYGGFNGPLDLEVLVDTCLKLLQS